MADWLIAIGTLLLAITALFQDIIRSIIWSPVLECEIEPSPPSCHRTVTSLKIEDARSNVKPRTLKFYSFYYRFKIWNRGKTSAKNVEVLISNILKKKGNFYKRIESFSQDNLKWSTLFDVINGHRVPKRYCEYISPDTFKHCNLGHIHDPEYRSHIPGEDNPDLLCSNNTALFCFDVHFMSSILYYLVEPGEYQIEIKVGCENAKTITKKFIMEFNGAWYDDEQKMLREGISISPILKLSELKIRTKKIRAFLLNIFESILKQKS